MSETDDRVSGFGSRVSGNCCQRGSLAKKVGIGAVVVGLPLGAFGIYKALENADQGGELVPGKGISLDAALRQVDPGLIKYKEVARIETGFSKPTAIAVDGKGDLLVGAEGMVRRFSRTGSLVGDVAVAGWVYCLAAGDGDVIYVGMKDHVEVYGGDGKMVKRWESWGEKAYLTSITVAGNTVWGGDAGRRVAVRCDGEGKVMGEIGKADASMGVTGLVLPSPHLDVAVGSDGLVWVNNPGMHRVEGYRADGQLERYWGEMGTKIEAFPGCCNPADLAVLKDGSFIVAEKVTPRVKKYGADGTFEGVVAAPDAFGQNMMGIDVAVDGEGRVLLMERGKREVRIFVVKEEGGK